MTTDPRCKKRHRVFGRCQLDAHAGGEHAVDYGGISAPKGELVARWTDEDEAAYLAHRAEQMRGKHLVEVAPGIFELQAIPT